VLAAVRVDELALYPAGLSTINKSNNLNCKFGHGIDIELVPAGMLEARVGFEPTDGGFADLSLRPLGYRAPC
jgi:hypothetical protein